MWTGCKTGAPLGNIRVRAFDVDWLQDDDLGSAVTDANGHFRIDYVSTDFKKDIFGFNIELFGGPDIYFKVETLGGAPLLTESDRMPMATFASTTYRPILRRTFSALISNCSAGRTFISRLRRSAAHPC